MPKISPSSIHFSYPVIKYNSTHQAFGKLSSIHYSPKGRKCQSPSSEIAESLPSKYSQRLNKIAQKTCMYIHLLGSCSPTKKLKTKKQQQKPKDVAVIQWLSQIDLMKKYQCISLVSISLDFTNTKWNRCQEIILHEYFHISALPWLSEQWILVPGLKDAWIANKPGKVKTLERFRGTCSEATYLYSKAW